ncbi:MAG: histidine kinase [Rikenellaceae bacterium]
MIDLAKTYSSYKILLISLGCSLFVIYPEITWIPFELNFMQQTRRMSYILFFIFRYAFYTGFLFLLIKINLEKIKTISLKKRFWYNTLVCAVGYAIYGGISFLIYTKIRHFGSLILFQFFIMGVLCTFMGHIILMYKQQRQKEQEIEKLKMENLQSRYSALTNQINPHFFFNSLNGLTSLIRKKDDKITLTYINKLSDVFRYILQSSKKGIVTLGEELGFVEAFSYMMEVRFAGKLRYDINIAPEMFSYRLPTLSILPILENIVVHNTIDSDHKMVVSILINDENELIISNHIHPKLTMPITNGTGLKNLENRFSLLMNRQIRVENDGVTFVVYLPLI